MERTDFLFFYFQHPPFCYFVAACSLLFFLHKYFKNLFQCIYLLFFAFSLILYLSRKPNTNTLQPRFVEYWAHLTSCYHHNNYSVRILSQFDWVDKVQWLIFFVNKLKMKCVCCHKEILDTVLILGVFINFRHFFFYMTLFKDLLTFTFILIYLRGLSLWISLR